MEPCDPRRRPRHMPCRSLAVVGILVLTSWVTGCDPEEQGMASCATATILTFDGREYVATDPRAALRGRPVRVGKKLGVGDIATCPEDSLRKVPVYRIKGIPVGQAVFARPPLGLMERSHEAATE